jgi:hypothetical protein
MGNQTQAVAPSLPVSPRDGTLLRSEQWQLARAAHVDLLLMGMPRINLLLIAPDAVVQHVLNSLALDLWKPVVHWSPGETLALPAPTGAGTLILHDVDALPPADQRRLVHWLELAKGRTQLVSTTSAPMLPRVTAGDFNATLFYRLNTVCVDVTTTGAQLS